MKLFYFQIVQDQQSELMFDELCQSLDEKQRVTKPIRKKFKNYI